MPTILQLLEIEATLSEMQAHQEAVILARNYFLGDQDVYLTDRSRDFLGIHENNTFKYNICGTIVRALAEELSLLGFSTDEQGEKKPVSDWVAGLYDRNKVDSLQDTVHEAALSDSESFIIVEWDPVEGFPRLIYNPYFVDVSAGGDGMGVWMIYENSDPDQRPIAAVKQWIEQVGSSLAPYSRLRRTVYYPDHFERWVYDNNSTWEHFSEPVEAADGETIIRDWIIPNVDRAGEPLGIPVFHFRNKGIRPEHWDAIPMQDGINKTLVDVLAAGDLTAFQSFFGFGFYPTLDGKAIASDGSNLMKIGPAQFNGTMKPPSEAGLTIIPGSDPTPLMNQFKDLVLATANLTDTPASRFIVTAAIASEKTIKEQERGLRKKGKDRRSLFSDPWVGVFDMARKLDNLFGSAGLSETVALSPVWEHTESLEELKEKRESLGIPLEQVWREAGYSEAQIESMRRDPSYRVEFERKLWEGANAASLQGIPLEHYLQRIGIPEEEIAAVVEAIENRSLIPPTGL